MQLFIENSNNLFNLNKIKNRAAMTNIIQSPHFLLDSHD